MTITIDQRLAELLNAWKTADGWPIGNFVLCIIALVLCVLFCGAVGLERERRGRTAGLRTHLLVGVGSCIIMIISIYGFPSFLGEDNKPLFNRDVARLAAQVVAGVGFLGAGAIIHRENGTRGLTTAGTIWIAMAIGLACGSFNFFIASIGTALIIIVLTVFRKLETRINKRNPLVIIQVPEDYPVLTTIIKTAEEFGCQIHGLGSELVEKSNEKFVEVTFQATFEEEKPRVNEFVCKLEEVTHARSVQLLNHKS